MASKKPPDLDARLPEAAVVYTKEPWRPSTLPRKIQKISFGVMSSKEVINTAELHVYERPLYSVTDRVPVANGLLDLRLGASKKTSVCQTCGQEMKDCTGHFGYIHLELPVFHIGYFKITVKTLQCICKVCSRVLLPQEERLKYVRQFRSEKTDRVRRDALFAAIVKKCKMQRQCPFCGSLNGPVKKVSGALKIVHEKFQKTDLYHNFLSQFSDAVRKNEFIEAHLRKASDDLNPIRVHALFSAVPDEECELLDLAGRPEDLIIGVVQVPPVCIRPSVEVDGGGGSNEDDITVKLGMVVDANTLIRNALQKGSKMDLLMEQWDFLQSQCACFINSDLPGLPSQLHQAPGKPVKGFVQRLKGKQGRFRGNLSGKRVDFTGRTVISPDPNLRVDEVAVPMQIAMTLTYPENVTPHNMQRLKKCILNGVSTWPGANMLTQAEDGSRLWLKFGDRTSMAASLRVGDTVERHLQDGDVVLFNRQPSLHRMSIMAHRVRVMPWRTLRFNECVCSPYNADFDGDEMNLHVPQTEEARAEALHLMGVIDNLCTPKNGEILIAATQDFLTSAFLLTNKDRFYMRADVGRLCAFMGDALSMAHLPVPAVCKPMELWTGKQVFSMLIRPDSQTRVFVNLETSEKTYKGQEHMCPMDGYVCFHNSDLVCGRLGKATLGGGNKSSLFQVLTTDFSARAAAAVMNRLAKLSARFIGEQGFSIGIDDVTPAQQLKVEKEATISGSYGECDTLICQFEQNRLPLTAGCDMEGSLEAQVTGVLNNIRESVSKVCMSTLPPHNSPLIMSQCGSKGSPINIAQMVACVGQQVVSGTRAPNGFKDRSLPHFPRGDKTPAGKGFVANSFYSGLTPTEFFFHTMAGREGLVDTAVKTAETGYMSRRLMKALEDLHTQYDGTVRNAASVIVQPEYGDDGMDPVAMEGSKGEPVALQQKLAVVKALSPKTHSQELAPLPAAFRKIVAEELAAMESMSASNGAPVFCSPAFAASLKAFLEGHASQWVGLREHLGLPLEERGEREAETAASMLALSEAQIRTFVRLCAQRYDHKRMDPGSTVGAFGAQSIGEPGTQMTLKTFHFAGVAAMNVTLGVPRIREIINASKKISTPIISVALEITDNESSARLVKARLEKTTLGQVADSISMTFAPSEASVRILLNWKTIAALQLDITPNSVATSLLQASKLKLKYNHIRVDDFGEVSIHPPAEGASKMSLLFQLQSLMQALPEVIVQGIPTISRAIVNKVKDKYELLVEGTDLQAVMGVQGVIGTCTTTNHVLEAASSLGIEAARTTIMKEIKYTMGQHGMAIDHRHTMLLADCMTFKGDVLGITRFGIAKMKDSVLNLASFEKTTDHLFDAALHGRTDEITGVSESIIMGIPMPTGTGLFKLQHSAPAELPPARPPPLLSY